MSLCWLSSLFSDLGPQISAAIAFPGRLRALSWDDDGGGGDHGAIQPRSRPAAGRRRHGALPSAPPANPAQVGSPMLILMEYAENGSLDKFLQTHELNEGQRVQMVMDICDGLNFLHAKVSKGIESFEFNWGLIVFRARYSINLV